MKRIIFSLLGTSLAAGLTFAAAQPFIPSADGLSKVTILSVTRVETQQAPMSQPKLVADARIAN